MPAAGQTVVSRRRRTPQETAPAPPAPYEPNVWLRADYVSHIFHYRMPETVAIAAVNPVVPSPLTIKMAIIAALLRDGLIADAETLVPYLPGIEVQIRPPASALVFRALLRYVRPPADRGTSRIDSNTGGTYGTNLHNREFALWGRGTEGDGTAGTLTIFVRVPQTLAEMVTAALQQVPYLGAKDSLVTCITVGQEDPDGDEAEYVIPVPAGGSPQVGQGNYVVRLADFVPGANVDLRHIIPSQRDAQYYRPNGDDPSLFVLPGDMSSYGRVKWYRRNSS